MYIAWTSLGSLSYVMLALFVLAIVALRVAATSKSQQVSGNAGVIRAPRFFGIHAEPTKTMYVLLAVIPFALTLGFYSYFSYQNHLENPDDKYLPSISQMAAEMAKLMTDGKLSEDNPGIIEQYVSKDLVQFTESTFVRDTRSSLGRLALGMFLGSYLGLLLGLNMGLFRGMDALGGPFATFMAIVNPLAVLPILFIAFGTDELVKIVLIFIGTFFPITRSVYNATKQVAGLDQITKALTLGASQLAMVYRVILPQVMPAFVIAVMLQLFSAWLYLVASEAISSTEGLGYRIFLVRRNARMDIIIPYVVWMTMIGFMISTAFKKFVETRYHWYVVSEGR